MASVMHVKVNFGLLSICLINDLTTSKVHPQIYLFDFTAVKLALK